MAGEDKELQAISKIIEALQELDGDQVERVLEYVFKRLSIGTLPGVSSGVDHAPSSQVSTAARTDIRSLTAEKQPRSANDMVALLAYYLSEVAPEEESSKTINTDLIKKYFKMAGFPMPRSVKSALTNAAAAGYLENVSRGEYRLNPVGYNLVVHKLPR